MPAHDPGASPPVRRLLTATEQELAELADVLVDVVDGGASIGFMHPLLREKALDFWRHAVAEAERGARTLHVAEDELGIVGTVQLVLDLPENQPHRAELLKMIVHRRGRRRGLGAALVHAAEQSARAHGRSLLVLDTASADAERLYTRMGWIRCGTVPGYALLPDGARCDTTFFYRELDG